MKKSDKDIYVDMNSMFTILRDGEVEGPIGFLSRKGVDVKIGTVIHLASDVGNGWAVISEIENGRFTLKHYKGKKKT